MGMRLTPPALTVLLLAGCAPATNDPDPAAPSPLATPTMPKLTAGQHQITYKVGGTATKALITYATPAGQEQQNGASVPWRKAFKAPDFSVLTVSAQNKGTGTVTCEIDVDGKTKKKSTSSGAYAVVTCTTPLGF
jgi:hypothetical protein